MALVREIIPPEEEGGWTLVRNYSDAGMMIRQDGTGDLYSEAVDPDFANRTYTETDIPIDNEVPESDEPDEPDEPDEEQTEGERAIEILDTLLGE